MEKLSLLYASTLFDLALEHGAVNEFRDQASLMREVLQDNECQKMLLHPHIKASEKRDFLKKAFSGSIHDDLLSFLFLASDKNREAFILPSLDALIDLIERHMKIVTADVHTASALDEGRIAEMKKVLSAKLDKNVEISLNVDPSIIGGPYVYVDGYYIDWTVKKRLRDLTVHMKEGCSA